MNANDRRIVGLAMVGHATVHTFELSVPILVTVWLTAFDATTGTVGLVVAVGYALFGLGALPAGVLADAYGSRRLIAACLAGMGVSFLLLAVAPTLPVVGLALVCWGAAASVYHPAGLSLLSTGVDRRGRAFAYHGMAGNLGIALGPLATTLLLLAFDWRSVVALLAVPAGAAAALALGLDFDETAAVASPDGGADDGTAPEEDAADPRTAVPAFGTLRSEARALLTGGFLLVFGVMMLSGLYYRGVLTFLPALLGDLPVFDPVAVGGRSLEPARYLYSGLLVVGVLGQYAGGRLADAAREEASIVGAFVALAAVSLLYVPAMDAGVPALLAASAALGLFLFTVQPVYQSMVAAYSPVERRGLSYGLTYLGVFGVGALGAGIAGAVLDYASPAALFAVLAGFAALAALLGVVLLFGDRDRKRE